MTGFETARTVRYTGQDPDEVRRAFAADSERALAAGYVITRSRWDTSAGPPALVVDYLHASMDRPAAPRGPGGSAAAPRASGRGGLGEALLIAGVILAVIVALAVTIPTSPPTAAPTPAPAAVVVESPATGASAAAASPAPAAVAAESPLAVVPVESPA